MQRKPLNAARSKLLVFAFRHYHCPYRVLKLFFFAISYYSEEVVLTSYGRMLNQREENMLILQLRAPLVKATV
jgi:hypothetical protein